MGKTTLATNIARNAAVKEKISTLVFSLEMGGTKIVKRELSAIGKIDHGRIRSGKLHDDDWTRLTSAVGQLSEATMFIDDTSGLGLTQLRAKARRMKRKHDIGLIIVDYIQLMNVDGARTREEEVSTLSRGLKNLARELSVPVIALSQLNRALESRPNKRPKLSDLRDSGAIEQDADIIAFVYRDEVYNEESIYCGMAEIIIGKNRDGEIGTVHANFNGAFCNFSDFVGQWPYFEPRQPKQKGFGYGNKHADDKVA